MVNVRLNQALARGCNEASPMLRAHMDASLSAAVASAIRTLGVAREGLSALEVALAAGGPQGLGRAFAEAVHLMAAAPGRILVTGLGKSGLVARKIAATPASTGTPAAFLHPAAASPPA